MNLEWFNVKEDNAWSLKKDEMGKVWWRTIKNNAAPSRYWGFRAHYKIAIAKNSKFILILSR